MFHFAIHGMKSLHKISQAALNVNNENSKTVYFNLAADYLCNFLPSDPSSVIYPQIDCASFKANHTAMPQVPSPNQHKPTKYLLVSALSHQIQSPTNTQANLRLPEATRSNNWRTESVMTIFVDCWLRFDVEDSYELPGNEFSELKNF
jgi:sphingomyelin phosphodiesterase 4